MTLVYGLWETVDVQDGHKPRVKQPNIANLMCIYAQSKFTEEKCYDCYRNTIPGKIVGKMNQKRPDRERYRRLDACTQSEREVIDDHEAGGRKQTSVRDDAASQSPRT